MNFVSNSTPGWLNQKIEELVEMAHEQHRPGVKSKLKEIVPEYQCFDMSHYTSPHLTSNKLILPDSPPSF
jgi:hypothetical protein